MSITLDGTNGVTATSPATVKASAYLDAAGGNTATINGKLPIAIGDVPAAGSLTLLGTLATTSGSTVTLSGLTLTSYKSLQFVINGASGTSTAVNHIRLNGINVAQVYTTGATDIVSGIGTIDLTTGPFAAAYGRFYAGSWQDGIASGGPSGLTTASTSITFTISAGAFDAGSIVIYGVK